MTRGAPGSKRRKRKENPYGQFIMLHRSVSQLLASRELSLTEFGAYVEFLLHATWNHEDSNTRYPRSDSKMADIAGGDRSKWYKYRTRLKEIGLIQIDDYGDEVLPYFFEEEANDADSQQTVEDLPRSSAIQKTGVAKSQQPAHPPNIFSDKNLHSVEPDIDPPVAKSQQTTQDIDTNVETSLNTKADSRSVTAKKQQQPIVSQKCEKCDNPLHGSDLMWYGLRKRALCATCRNIRR